MGTQAPAAAAKPNRRSKRADWPYRFELVPLDRLFIAAEYQRPLTSFVESVAREYDPALIGCLIVSEREDDRFAVIDGQTRTEAMRRVVAGDAKDPDGQPVPWHGEAVAPCLVYIGLTVEDEARLFADLQTKRRGMATYLRFRAALVAKQPEAVAIAGIVRAAGFELDVQEKPDTVKAIAALEWTYRRDPAVLARVMGIIAAAWPDPSIEFRTGGDLIRGIALFITREKNVDDNRLMDRLAGVTPRMLRHRANALQEGSGAGSGGRAAYMADAILGVYMRGGR